MGQSEHEDDPSCYKVYKIIVSNTNVGGFNIDGIDPTCGNDDGQIIISGLANNADYDISYDFNGSTIGPNVHTSTSSGKVILDNKSKGGYSNFIVQPEDDCAMQSLDDIQLNPADGPNVQAPQDKTICLGESITLTAINPNHATILWDNNIVDGQAFTPNTEIHTYTVTATIDNCSVTDQVTITVVEGVDVDFIADVTEGCSPLEVSFTNLTAASSLTDCFWDFGDGTTANVCDNPVHTYKSPGLYSVALTVSVDGGCSSKEVKTNYINVSALPKAKFTADPMVTTIYDTQIEFENQSSDATSFEWDFGDGSGISHDLNPIHEYEPELPNNYIVTLVASNGEGCSDTVRVLIKIEDDVIFYVPNAFTPDGDEHNDVFKPIIYSGIDKFDFSLSIYNRWGELVFQTYDTEIGWDGTFKDNIVKEGVYVWKIEFLETMSDKRHVYNGHVTIIK